MSSYNSSVCHSGNFHNDNNQVNLSVTPGHRMVYRREKYGNRAAYITTEIAEKLSYDSNQMICSGHKKGIIKRHKG